MIVKRRNWWVDVTAVELLAVALFFVGGSILSVGFAVAFVGTQVALALRGGQ